MNTTKNEITKSSPEFKECMRAGRHLSAHRMAWAANSVASGVDYCGCKKSHIVLSLIGKSYSGRTYSVAAVVYAFETERNTEGRMAISDATREQATAEAEAAEKRAAWFTARADAFEARHGRVNYSHAHNASVSARKATALRAGLEGERSPYSAK